MTWDGGARHGFPFEDIAAMTIEPLSAEYGSWHPGLELEIPREYLPLSTMFRIENVSTSISKAYELSDYCSLPPTELVAFRAERLIIHELLIHVTTTISVPDGGDYEDLGRNFREINSTILKRYIAPHRAELAERFDRFRHTASVSIEREIAKSFAEPRSSGEQRSSHWRHRLFGTDKQQNRTRFPENDPVERDRSIAFGWRKQAKAATDPLDAVCFDALHRIATGIMDRHDRLVVHVRPTFLPPRFRERHAMPDLHHRLHFGAADHPEYQTEKRLEWDLDHMLEAGFTVIRVGESVWPTWEPEETGCSTSSGCSPGP